MIRKRDKALRSELNEYLAKEIMNSELLRARVMLWIFVAALGSFIILVAVQENRLPEMLRGNNAWFPIAFLTIFTVYESFVARYLKAERELGRKLPIFFQYFSAFEETSLITVALLLTLILFEKGDPEVLITPIPFMYFLFIAVSALRLSFWVSFMTGVFAGAGYFGFVQVALTWYVDIVPGSLLTSYFNFIERAGIMILTGIVTGLVTRQIRTQLVKSFEATQERGEIINIFGQHVSPQVVDQLLQQGADRGSENRHVCVMFLDIRDYTKFSEGKNPQEIVNYLNTLFGFMIDIVNQHNGIINKFLGDGFMAVFGAPISDGSDIKNAVSASFALLKSVEEAVKDKTIPATRIGIGLHAGDAITGDVGSARRKEYTVIGDVVNMASRIETLNKQFTSQFLVSKDVWKVVSSDDSIEGESLGKVEIKGVSAPVEIFKLG